MEWRAGMESSSPSTITVRLSAVRKMVGEARRAGMIGQEEASTRKAQEREIERGLLIHLRDLLLELGRGFAFIGSQVPLEVGGEMFYIDLLFYHVRLHSYFVIELKTGKFKPEN
jgi:hypothetical protein